MVRVNDITSARKRRAKCARRQGMVFRKVWVSSVDPLVQFARTGAEVTSRRENSGEKRLFRSLGLIIGSIFYSLDVIPSLDVLVPCKLPSIREFLALSRAGHKPSSCASTF